MAREKRETPESTEPISQPKSRTTVWITLIVLAFVMIIAIIIVANNGFRNSRVIDDGNNCRNVQVPYNETGYTTVSEPYTENICDDVNMVYKESYSSITNSKDCIQQECISYTQVCSKKNFWGNCVEYTNGNCENYRCIKYKINCGVKITNQEKQPLIYSLNLESYNYDTKQASIVKVQDVYVAPLDTAEYLWDFTALPTDRLGCIYVSNSAPTMKNCHDVINYHDVPKTVVVTKYRTEQQCD